MESYKITINGRELILNPEWRYNVRYGEILEDIQAKKVPANAAFRSLCQNDLFFLMYFVMGVDAIHHPFGLETCRILDEEKLDTNMPILDLWARGHFKSSAITAAKTIQRILTNPEETTCILSYCKTAAEKLLRPVKLTLETSEFLKTLFPDILYQDPHRESPKWSEGVGITVKRKSVAKECTLEAWGLIEGMPTGSHFNHLIYDDVETHDTARSPDVTNSLIDAFSMSLKLGTLRNTVRVIGTTYVHTGLLQKLRTQKKLDGKEAYLVRVRPATDDGTESGTPVLFSREKLDQEKLEADFNAQYLLDPTPRASRKLLYEKIIHLPLSKIPVNRLYKFLIIDPAGSEANKKTIDDAWSFHVIGILPRMNDRGASAIYLLDSVVRKLDHATAMDEIVKMYLRNGRIRAIGVEKAGQSTTEIHISKALLAKGINISVDADTLIILRPLMRNKKQRIVEGLQWQLDNNQMFFSENLSQEVRMRFQQEMDMFPFWHDDALDALSYIQDIAKTYKFPALGANEDLFADDGILFTGKRYFSDNKGKFNKNGWMSC